jgi:hypothetical protein
VLSGCGVIPDRLTCELGYKTKLQKVLQKMYLIGLVVFLHAAQISQVRGKSNKNKQTSWK